MNNLEEQILYLKTITERWGLLHEAQVLQLKMWPLLLPQIKSAEVLVDTDNHYVEIKAVSKTKRFKKTKKFIELQPQIAKWIKYILWSDTVVVIKVNDKLTFDSRNPSAYE
jgi:hypothetical protein